MSYSIPTIIQSAELGNSPMDLEQEHFVKPCWSLFRQAHFVVLTADMARVSFAVLLYFQVSHVGEMIKAILFSDQVTPKASSQCSRQLLPKNK